MLVLPDESRQVWLVVHAKPKQEAALVEALHGRGIVGYCPRVVEPRLHARAPHVPMPLFPSYVFARCAPVEKYQAVRYCHGAAGIVRFGERLGAVAEEFIALLREREGERGYLLFSETRRAPAAGARVRIVQGPLQGVEGIVTHYLPARDRVRLLLTMVGGIRNVEVEAGHVRGA